MRDFVKGKYQIKTICFDLNQLQNQYGAASASVNDNRIDRFFAHELTHLLFNADKPCRRTHVEPQPKRNHQRIETTQQIQGLVLSVGLFLSVGKLFAFFATSLLVIE